MRTIVLHGRLAEHLPAEMNGRFTCDFATPVQAASAIEANWPGFHSLLREMSVHVVTDENRSLGEKQTNYKLNCSELHIMPAVEGSGGKRGLKAVLGIALIAVSFGVGGLVVGGLSSTVTVGGIGLGITGQTLLSLGAGMVLQALVQPPKAPTPGGSERQESSFYQGPLNTQNEGEIVPYVAGTNVIAGGVVIATDIIVEQRL